MTAAASGSSGITVADNDNIDFGTGNFTLIWRGSLPDWTPANTTYIIYKNVVDQGYILTITATGYINLLIDTRTIGGTADNYTSSIPLTLINGTSAEICVSITQKTVTTPSSVYIYINGIQFGTELSVNAGALYSCGNAGQLYILGVFGLRNAGTCSFAATFNRALSAAEVLDLYRNGISYVDKWGGHLITGDNSTFASDTGWWGKNTGVTISGGVTHFANVSSWGLIRDIGIITSKKYIVTFTISNYVSGSVYAGVGSGANGTSRTANGTYTEEITASGNSYFYLYGNGATCDIDNITLSVVGATLALEPEGIQNDKWYGSANSLNASYPAAGWSLARNLNVPRTNTGQPAFFAYNSATDSNVTGDGTAVVVDFDTEVFDNTNNFTGDTFTAPVTGKYCLTTCVYLTGLETGDIIDIILITSNRSYGQTAPFVYTNQSISINCVADMDVGDTAYVALAVTNGDKDVDIFGHATNSYTFFAGYLVC
jgi:hypothetical protein